MFEQNDDFPFQLVLVPTNHLMYQLNLLVLLLLVILTIGKEQMKEEQE